MRVNLDELLPVGVTVINRLDGNPDAYYATYLPEAQWDVEADATAGDTTLDVGQIFRIQLPKSITVDGKEIPYEPFNDWKTHPVDAYTCRVGDWVVKGEVTEEITASSLRGVLDGYKPDVCVVSGVSDKTAKAGLYPQSKTGAMRFLEFIYVEGV